MVPGKGFVEEMNAVYHVNSILGQYENHHMEL